MKRLLKIVGIILALLLVVALVLPFVVNVNSFRPRLESEMTAALGRKVTVGNLGLSILAGSVSAEDLAIADDPAFSKEPFVKAKSLNVGVELWPLILSKKLNVTNIVLDQPQIRLIQSPAGKWNFSNLGGNSDSKPSQPSSSNLDLSVKKLAVKNGSITMGKTNSSKVQAYKDVNITVENFSATSQFPFTMSATLPGNADLKLEGNGGPLAKDIAETPLDAQIAVKHMDIGASGFVEPSSGIAGIADFSGKVNSDGHVVHTSGDLTADKLKLAEKATPASRTVQLKYAIEHNLGKNSGALTRGDVAIGKAVAKLTGTYQIQGDTTTLNAKLVGDALPVEELQAMLPALGIALPSGSSLKGGTLSMNLSLTGNSERPVVTGPIHMDNSMLTGFSISSKLGAISQFVAGIPSTADTPIQTLSTDVQYSNVGIQTQNMNLNVPTLGIVTGSGTMAPGGALDYKMSANLNGSVTIGLAKMAGLGGKGGAIPFFIRGTSSNPKFEPDLKGMLGGGILKGGGANGQTPAGSVVDTLTGFFGKKKTSK
jgi:AsmA protein